MQAKRVWIISVPNSVPNSAPGTRDVFTELQRATKEDTEETHKFQFPELRVGNIDSLITLSDELRKLDTHVESTLRKIATQYDELASLQQEPKKDLDVRGLPPLTFFTKFKWDEARFSKRKPLPELAHIVQAGITKMDEELRAKTGEYSSLEQKINQVHQSTQGNLLTRDITKDITAKKEHIYETKYLTTVFVVVPSSEIKDWWLTYSTLNEFVVPDSCVLVKEENDFSLFLVVVMKHASDDFKTKCRGKRFTARKYDPSQTISEEDFSKLQNKFEKAQRHLIRWAATNFGEAFYMWVHLKCIQVYVESILRYGLPADFQAMIVIPKRNHEQKLEKILCAHYSYIGRDFADVEDDEVGAEKFFPYVFSEGLI